MPRVSKPRLRQTYVLQQGAFCVVYLETVDCAQGRSRTNEQARQMYATML